MIRIKSLTKQFEEVTAVNNLTLNFENGVTGLVGHNGAGKSTLLRLIASVYSADKGTITINNYDSKDVEGKSQVFFLSDNPYANNSSTIKEIYKFYECFFTLNKGKFDELINKFNLPTNRKVANFSKGMRRQLFISLALSSECPVLLLDEAFDGLDPLALEHIKDEIINASEGERTIVISSHNISTLERICDRFVILHKGRVGSKTEVEDLGTTFYKYQALFEDEVKEKTLTKLGYNIITFKKVGSLCVFVTDSPIDEEVIKKQIATTLIENISMDASEIISTEMLLANKKDKEEDE